VNQVPNSQGGGAKKQAQGGGGGGAGEDKRNYDKPWLVPKKEKEPQTYLESVYPDGVGPDLDLIQMLERDMIEKNPNVKFEDIADLTDTKKAL